MKVWRGAISQSQYNLPNAGHQGRNKVSKTRQRMQLEEMQKKTEKEEEREGGREREREREKGHISKLTIGIHDLNTHFFTIPSIK